jgi:hypothetical protein
LGSIDAAALAQLDAAHELIAPRPPIRPPTIKHTANASGNGKKGHQGKKGKQNEKGKGRA